MFRPLQKRFTTKHPRFATSVSPSRTNLQKHSHETNSKSGPHVDDQGLPTFCAGCLYSPRLTPANGGRGHPERDAAADSLQESRDVGCLRSSVCRSLQLSARESPLALQSYSHETPKAFFAKNGFRRSHDSLQSRQRLRRRFSVQVFLAVFNSPLHESKVLLCTSGHKVPADRKPVAPTVPARRPEENTKTTAALLRPAVLPVAARVLRRTDRTAQSWVWSLVLMTSNGFDTKPAKPPLRPAKHKHLRRQRRQVSASPPSARLRQQEHLGGERPHRRREKPVPEKSNFLRRENFQRRPSTTAAFRLQRPARLLGVRLEACLQAGSERRRGALLLAAWQ